MPDIRDPMTPDVGPVDVITFGPTFVWLDYTVPVSVSAWNRMKESVLSRMKPHPDAWATHVHEHGVRARKAYRLPGAQR